MACLSCNSESRLFSVSEDRTQFASRKNSSKGSARLATAKPVHTEEIKSTTLTWVSF